MHRTGNLQYIYIYVWLRLFHAVHGNEVEKVVDNNLSRGCTIAQTALDESTSHL